MRAYDYLGLHNHGTINIGDTFTEGEAVMFTGNFRISHRNSSSPVRGAARSTAHEGAAEGFGPAMRGGCDAIVQAATQHNDLILGAVGQLQFEVVAFRLQDEYNVQCSFDNINVHTARWVYGRAAKLDGKKLEEFRAKAYDNLSLDHSGALVYASPRRGSIYNSTLERWPDIDVQGNARASQLHG